MIKINTIVRTIVALLVMINESLMIFGITEFQNISEDQVYTVVSTVAMIVAWAWTWWKNNSFTESAIIADELMNELKGGDE